MGLILSGCSSGGKKTYCDLVVDTEAPSNVPSRAETNSEEILDGDTVKADSKGEKASAPKKTSKKNKAKK